MGYHSFLGQATLPNLIFYQCQTTLGPNLWIPVSCLRIGTYASLSLSRITLSLHDVMGLFKTLNSLLVSQSAVLEARSSQILLLGSSEIVYSI